MERSVSIFFLPYVHGAADDLWLIPYAARQDPDVFEINVSNANGAELLLAIGLNPSAEQTRTRSHAHETRTKNIHSDVPLDVEKREAGVAD